MTATGSSEGYVYALAHPRMTGWFKVGKTTNPRRRIKQYQTGDPLREYRFVFLLKTESHHIEETELIERLTRLGYLPHGEWFEVPFCVLHREFAKVR